MFLNSYRKKQDIHQESFWISSIQNFWANVTKAEFTRMVHLLIDKITVYNDHVDMDIKYGGLKSIEKDFTEK